MSTDEFLKYQLLQLCQNAVKTCPFTNPVAGTDCTNKFCTGFPAYIGVGTCVSLGEDPDNCCASSDPTACLQNYAHGSGSGSVNTTPNVCASVISILDDCFSATPALSPSANALVSTAGPSATALASCACYDSDGTFDPDTLDNFASECAASGSAAHPTYFPLVTPLQGFCTNNADAPGSAAASTTPPAAAASTTPVASTPKTASAAATTPVVATSTTSPLAGNTGISSKGSTTTAVDAGSDSSSTSSGAGAQTTSGKSSSGFKLTVRSSAVLVLLLSMFLNY